MATRNVFDVTGSESVVVDEQFISRPAVTSEPPDGPVAPMGPVAPIVPPPPPPVMASVTLFASLQLTAIPSAPAKTNCSMASACF
jgi:hypothetical protein